MSIYDSIVRGRHPETTERIRLEEGWDGLTEGWFCELTVGDRTVEEFGTTKRSALRYARRLMSKPDLCLTCRGSGKAYSSLEES